VLAARDSDLANASLVSLFTHAYNDRLAKRRLERFHFVFTGGTYERLFCGATVQRLSGGAADDPIKLPYLDERVAHWLERKGGVTRLRPAAEGGVTILSYLLTQRKCSIVWPFFAAEHHWLRPENLAFMRLCDQWHVKRLMNAGSVLVWLDHEADHDSERNLQIIPPVLTLRVDEESPPAPIPLHAGSKRSRLAGEPPPLAGTWKRAAKRFSEMTVALIAHDGMKGRMVEFAIDHEAELVQFGKILATGSTGREVAAATSRLIDRKLFRYHSGPKGGDIEIATEILHGQCDLVIFFVDPLFPHPHSEDIRTVFQACMLRDDVVMITNEMHAREFMSRVVRGGKSSIDLFTHQ